MDENLSDTVETLKERVNEISTERKHKPIIVAHASYHGELIRGNYQFTFGGSSVESYRKHDIYNGFLMPHSGYIKRFVLEDTGYKFYTSEDLTVDNFLLKYAERLNYKPFPIFFTRLN